MQKRKGHKLTFQGRKHLLAWLRSDMGHAIREQLVAEETWASPSVVIVTEGNGVSVYVQGRVRVKHVERPLVRWPAAIDKTQERMDRILEGYRHRATFFTDPRSITEQFAEDWPLHYGHTGPQQT